MTAELVGEQGVSRGEAFNLRLEIQLVVTRRFSPLAFPVNGGNHPGEIDFRLRQSIDLIIFARRSRDAESRKGSLSLGDFIFAAPAESEIGKLAIALGVLLAALL